MQELLIFLDGYSIYEVAQKNGLIGTNGRMSRHMETTAREYHEGNASGRAGKKVHRNERTGRFRLLAKAELSGAF